MLNLSSDGFDSDESLDMARFKFNKKHCSKHKWEAILRKREQERLEEERKKNGDIVEIDAELKFDKIPSKKSTFFSIELD